MIDKLASAGKAKVSFTAKDPGIDKGGAGHPGGIGATLVIRYGDEKGTFTVPSGASNGLEGWISNDAAQAKYRNRFAPLGSTTVRTTLVKQGKLVKLVANGLGDGDALDILSAGPPSDGRVSTAYCVDNGATENCFCSTHHDCKWRPNGGGTGATSAARVASPIRSARRRRHPVRR